MDYSQQLKYPFVRENFQMPYQREFDDYIFSPDGSLLAAIDKKRHFFLYQAEDLAAGQFRCFYQYVETPYESIKVQAAAFAEFGPLSTFSEEISLVPKQLRPNISKLIYSYRLVIAPQNEDKDAIILIFNISKLEMEATIRVTAPIESMKIDKLIPTILYYIEKGKLRRLIKYDLQLKKFELIAADALFFEELDDGSLIIATQNGIKFYNQKTSSLSIKGITPYAFFSLGYQKVLMIGYTANLFPSFMIFNPYSNINEPIYPLPYFTFPDVPKPKFSNESKKTKSKTKQQFFCTSFCGPQSNPDIPDRGTSIYIASSLRPRTNNTTNYLVHISSTSDFYYVESVEPLEFDVRGMRRFYYHGDILGILGESNLSLLKFNDLTPQSNDFKSQLSPQQNKGKSEISSNPQFKKAWKSIMKLPTPSNPLQAVESIAKEIDPIIDSFKPVQRILKSQAQTVQLLSILKSKKPWDPSYHDFYKNKIEKEEKIIDENFDEIKKKLDSSEEKKTSYQIRYSPD